MYTSAIDSYGKKEQKSADWYEAHWEEMEPVTEAKRKAYLAYKAKPSPSTLEALRATRKKAQQTAHHCANTYWLNLCTSIQTAAQTGNTRGMYEGIKKATGPTPTRPLHSNPRQAKSLLTKRSRCSSGPNITLNITLSCMRHKRPSPTPLSTPSQSFPSW